MSDMLRSAPRGHFPAPKLDWAWLFILLSPGVWYALSLNGMVLFDHHHAGQIVSLPHFVADSFIHIGMYFAFAVVLGAYAIASNSAELVRRAFQFHQPLAIALAGLAGTFSPLCSCGVLPVIAAMFMARVPLAPIMAFWLASPLMAPEQFVITQSFLGIPFTSAKLIFALCIGITGGYLTYALSASLGLSSQNVLRPNLNSTPCCNTSATSNQQRVIWAIWRVPNNRIVFMENLWATFLFLGKWLLLAFVLEALMSQLNLVRPLVTWIAGMGSLAIPLSAFIGIPAYLNGDAAPALVSALVDEGLPQGAAMAFLIGGGITCIPAAVAVWSLVRVRVFGLYLAYGLGGAIFAGFATTSVMKLFT